MEMKNENEFSLKYSCQSPSFGGEEGWERRSKMQKCIWGGWQTRRKIQLNFCNVHFCLVFVFCHIHWGHDLCMLPLIAFLKINSKVIWTSSMFLKHSEIFQSKLQQCCWGLILIQSILHQNPRSLINVKKNEGNLTFIEILWFFHATILSLETFLNWNTT